MSQKAGRAQNPDFFPLAAPRGINYLFAIGIDAYAHCARLYNCVKDAQDFMQALVGKYRFEAEHIVTLFDAQATRRNILNQLRSLRDRVTPQDNLIIYFSGHGEYDAKSETGFWIPVEAQPLEDAEYISNADITARLNAIDSFHTFLIVDACFAGSLFVNYKNVQPGAESKRSRWGLAASHSREVALDGTRGDNSPFARCLIRTISQNTDVLGVQELAAAVIDQVQQETGGKQTPVGQPLNVKGHDLGQFFFHLKMNEAQDWAAAKRDNTLAAYQRFVAMYPNGINTAEAQTTVAFLQEEAAWKEAQNANTIAAYDRYLQAYRQGRYSRLAIDAQKTLEEDAAWQRATQRNTISAYRDFQYNYTESKYYKEAEGRIQQLQTPTEPPMQRNSESKLGSEYYVEGSVVEQQTLVASVLPPLQQELEKKSSYVEGAKIDSTVPVKWRFSLSLTLIGILLIIALWIWQPWKSKETTEPTTNLTQSRIENGEEKQGFTEAQHKATKEAFTLFLRQYPDGAYATEAKMEIQKMEEVGSAFKNAQAYLKGGLIEDTTVELKKVEKLNTDNKFVKYALDALQEKDYKKAMQMIEDGILFQNQKLTPAAPRLGG